MKRLSILGAAAIVASLAALPSIAQAECAKYDPSCATYPRPKNDAPAVNRTSVRTDVYRSAPRPARVERRVAVRDPRYADRYYDRGPGPAGVVGGAVGAAVGTAGAIATAPARAARAADAYAYDRDGGYYTEGYGVPRQSYAERNGFTCTPGTLIKGFDGRMHVCQ